MWKALVYFFLFCCLIFQDGEGIAGSVSMCFGGQFRDLMKDFQSLNDSLGRSYVVYGVCIAANVSLYLLSLSIKMNVCRCDF